MILDDGGDATFFILLGSKAEKDPSLIANPTNEEEECLFAEIKKRLGRAPVIGKVLFRTAMKILVAGDWHSKLHEQALYDALVENGHDVYAFAWHTYFRPEAPVFYKWRLVARAQNKYLLGPRVNRLNRDFVEHARACEPDAIIVYRGSHIFPQTLRTLRAILPRTKLVGYNNDDPFSPSTWRS